MFVVGLALLGFDYGKMRLHEINAAGGDLLSGKEQASADETDYNENGRIIDLLFPVIALIVCSVLALIYCGGILDGDAAAP